MTREQPIIVAIDAMGGYEAPDVIIEAVAEASESQPFGRQVYFNLVGDEAVLTQKLLAISHNPERILLQHAPSHVAMGESARGALEHKPRSSIFEACRIVADGQANALVSAGHPGAAVLGALHYFRPLPGIDRAALAAVYPTPRLRGQESDPFALLLDVGASLRAGPRDLLGFAYMGTAYAQLVSKNPSPRVALLNTSRESSMGPAGLVKAHQLLSVAPNLNFIGNIEGHDIPRGAADVIVCEGYVGDVSVKILEGVYEAMFELARAAYEHKFVWRQGLRLLEGGLNKLKRLTDFEEYGGAPLLGLDKVIILAHPRSSKKAFHNAIKLAIKTARDDLAGQITTALRELHATPRHDEEEHELADAPQLAHTGEAPTRSDEQE